MDQIGILEIAAGVLAGNLLTAAFLFSIRHIDRKGEDSASLLSLMGAALPLLFVSLMVYITV